MNEPARKRIWTYAEYLEQEPASPTKHEFRNGQIFAMIGGTPEHARLCASVGTELRAQLRGRPCAVYSSDLRIRVQATGLSTYPDVSVVCGRLERDLAEKLATRVKLAHARNGRGKLVIHYHSLDELDGILERSGRSQLKGVLRDQRTIAGIGNAYSDEILHAARMSPFKPAGGLDAAERATLYAAIRGELSAAVERASGLAAKELKDDKRAGMRVHGRTGQACPVCGSTIAEVSFADSSLQYCPTCQTGGKPLADRRLSRLLK